MSAGAGHSRPVSLPVSNLVLVIFTFRFPGCGKLISVVTDIPINEYYEYFGPDYKLDVKSSNMEDMNSRGYLDRVKGIVLDHLRHTGGPPSVQMSG